MSKTTKWIVGVLFGLLLVCLIVTVSFMVFSRINSSAWGMGVLRDWDGGRSLPREFTPWDNMPMRLNRWLPNMLMRNYFPFRGLFSGLLCLGFLSLIVLGIVALVLSLTRSKKPAVTVASDAPSTPLAEGSQMGIPARSCSNCQRPVNDDWSHCPYCGTALTPPE